MYATPANQQLKLQNIIRGGTFYFLVVIFFIASIGFLELQNSTHAIGGTISLPKALWLDWTLTTFYLLPFFLWKNTALSPQVRSLFGWLLLSFVLRGVAEINVLYATHAWKCSFGISHNVFTITLALFLYARLPRPFSLSDRRALSYLALFINTLVFESLNAWQFSLLADPGRGVYFAANTPHFAFVNRLTWIELAILWPWFCVLLWKSRCDFFRS